MFTRMSSESFNHKEFMPLLLILRGLLFGQDRKGMIGYAVISYFNPQFDETIGYDSIILSAYPILLINENSIIKEGLG